MSKLKTIKIKGKDYVQVSERVKDFNATYPNGKIITEIVSQDENTITMRAVITPDVKNPERYFTGYAHEDKSNANSMVNKTSHIENCETSAVGRALAMMGIGIVDSIASADEVFNAQNSDTTRPIPDAETPTCSNCGGKMKASKFKKGDWYCPDYKKEKTKAVPVFPEVEPTFDEQGNHIPFD